MSTPSRKSSFASNWYARTSASSASRASRGVAADGSRLPSALSTASCCACSRPSEVGGRSVTRTLPSPAARKLTLPPSWIEKPSEPRSLPQVAESVRSEEHTSELQSRPQIVCRLLLEKTKNTALYIKLSQSEITLSLPETNDS